MSAEATHGESCVLYYGDNYDAIRGHGQNFNARNVLGSGQRIVLVIAVTLTKKGW